eukprot:3774403-Alexandrium_andersonii.AAC.1
MGGSGRKRGDTGDDGGNWWEAAGAAGSGGAKPDGRAGNGMTLEHHTDAHDFPVLGGPPRLTAHA